VALSAAVSRSNINNLLNKYNSSVAEGLVQPGRLSSRLVFSRPLS